MPAAAAAAAHNLRQPSLRLSRRASPGCRITRQDPTGEAASEAQKHLTLYELDLGLNHVVS